MMDRSTLTLQLANLQTAYPGQDIDQLRRQAFGFCNDLMRRPWFVDKREMVHAEGGINSMAYNAILEALTIGDATSGFQNYLSHLAHMYGNQSHENRNVSLDELIEKADSDVPLPAALLNMIAAEDAESGASPHSLDSGSPAALLIATLNEAINAGGARAKLGPPRLRYNEQELDLLDTLASVGSVVEASALVRMSYKRARQVLFNLRRTIKRWALAAPRL